MFLTTVAHLSQISAHSRIKGPGSTQDSYDISDAAGFIGQTNPWGVQFVPGKDRGNGMSFWCLRLYHVTHVTYGSSRRSKNPKNKNKKPEHRTTFGCIVVILFDTSRCKLIAVDPNHYASLRTDIIRILNYPSISKTWLLCADRSRPRPSRADNGRL